jgi:acetylornithine deacetylase/succinyl-diaminopimelate desuccinylase-like protein
VEAGYPEDDVDVVGPRPDLGNLVVRLRGSGRGGRPILLMAHIDVVPAVAEAWSTDPYRMVEDGGFYYGRGAIDNKAGAATLVANLLRWKREGWVPERDVIVALTADEETTQESIAWLVRERRDLVDAELALNTDAGFGEVRDGKRGLLWAQASEKMYLTFRLTATNAGGHSSVPRPDNAIVELVRAIASIADHRFPVRTDEVTRAFFSGIADTYPDEVAGDLRAVAAEPVDEAAAERLARRSPTFNAMLRTTCTPTMLAAGHAENALPREASAVVNCRIFPGVPADEVEATLRRLAASPAIIFERMNEPVPSPPSVPAPLVRATFDAVAAEIFPGSRLTWAMETGATDGLYTRNGGIPTYGIGAIFDDPEDIRAHGKDERVGVEAFHDAVEFWYRMVMRIAGRGVAS